MIRVPNVRAEVSEASATPRLRNSITCNPAGRAPNAIRSIEAARFHLGSRRRGVVAAGGAGAAAAADAAHWCAYELRGGRSGGKGPNRCVRTRVAAIGLD